MSHGSDLINPSSKLHVIVEYSFPFLMVQKLLKISQEMRELWSKIERHFFPDTVYI